MRVALVMSFLFSFVVGLFAQVDLNKKMDYSARNLTLDKALNRLSKRSDISIAFSDKLLPRKARITVKFRKKSFRSILEHLLRNTGLAYKVVGDQVVLFKATIRTYTISGYVKDATNGERLIASHVFEKESIRGSTTNEYGFYSLTLKEGTVKVLFSYLGYENVTKVLQLYEDTRLDIELQPTLMLEEILVLDDDSTNMRTFSLEQISQQFIHTLPSLGGEPDVFRVAQLLPSVQTGADGVGGIHVRGGNTDQNLYLLDGVPIYNPSHLAGIFSVYDTDAIRSTQLLKDFIPTRYGGRLSSVLDVRTKEGNTKEWQGSLGIGLTSVKASLEGPIKKNKGAIFISGRRSLLDFVVKPITKDLKERRNEEGFSDYGFYDLNAKVNYMLSPKDQLYFSMYTGKDDFYDENKSVLFDNGGIDVFRQENKTQQDLNWGNNVGALRWNHLFNPKLFLNTTFTYSDYRFQSRNLNQELQMFTDAANNSDSLQRFAYTRYESRIQDWALKTDFDYVAGPNHYWRFGFEGVQHNFHPGVRRTEDPDLFSGFENSIVDTFTIPATTADEYSVYLEDQWTLFGKWKTNVGVRGTAFKTNSKTWWRASPRFQMWYEVNPKWRLKSSFNLMHQYLHLLTTSTIGLPNDLWVPATETIAPQSSWQALVGMEHEGKEGIRVSLDVFYKKMNQLITYQEGTDLSGLDARNWEDKVTTGQGESYGAEFFLHKKIGKWTTWLTYAWSKTTRQFDEVNLGRTFPYRYDRRHNMQVNALYNINEKCRIAANWNYGTGLAITLPQGKYEFPIEPSTIITATDYGNRNDIRMPAYHRLDLDFSYRISKKWGSQLINIGVYNIYGRKNPIYYRIGRDPNDINKKRYLQATLFQILPYFSYRITF